MTTPMETFYNSVKQIAEYYKLHEIDADYQDLKDILDKYDEDSKHAEINKIGIEISGKLFVFRRVTEFKCVKLADDPANNVYSFYTSVKKNHI